MTDGWLKRRDERYSNAEYAYGIEPNDFLKKQFKKLSIGKYHPVVSKGLPVNFSDAFDVTNVVSVLCPKVTGVAGFYFISGLLFLFFIFQRRYLCIRKNQAILLRFSL